VYLHSKWVNSALAVRYHQEQLRMHDLLHLIKLEWEVVLCRIHSLNLRIGLLEWAVSQ
jgi:hypothetical protein